MWFRTHLADVHGIDLAAGMAAPERVLATSASDPRTANDADQFGGVFRAESSG